MHRSYESARIDSANDLHDGTFHSLEGLPVTARGKGISVFLIAIVLRKHFSKPVFSAMT
jgi:hypothetical protein